MVDDIKNILIVNLKIYMVNHDLNQKGLAKKLGTSSASLSLALNGKSSLDKLVDFYSKLDYKTEYDKDFSADTFNIRMVKK